MKFFCKSKSRRLTPIIIGILLLAVVVFCVVYVNDYYRADKTAIEEFLTENNISKQILEDNTLVYVPENIRAGFIFYPGGKVEYTAYEPLMKSLASEGILCVLIKMPFYLAVLDVDAADGIQSHFPEVENWYIGGHSLGGSMAASYLEENVKDYKGLILLGSYSVADLSSEPIEVLSVYGSEDKVLNYKNYEEDKSNLPKNMKEVVIEGGCHAYFGMYGEQEGDGEPTISNEEQIEITTESISDFVK